VNCAETAEPIDMLFGMSTEPKKPCVRWGSRTSHVKRQFWGWKVVGPGHARQLIYSVIHSGVASIFGTGGRFHICHPRCSIIQSQVQRRAALDKTRHILKWFIHLRAQRPKEGRWASRCGLRSSKESTIVCLTSRALGF